MYPVDDKDAVIALEGFPMPASGGPDPFLIADERTVVLAYMTLQGLPERGPRVCEEHWDDSGEDYVIICISPCYAHYLGPPGDEVLGGHPLASRGLGYYGAFLVTDSSWVRSQRAMNAVHPRHNPEWYANRHHFIITFQDSTFECVAKELDIRYFQGPEDIVLGALTQLVRKRAT